MNHSESLANIAAALSKAQAAVKVAVKDSVNPHLKSKYADLGSVFDACRDALADNGLSVVQMPVTDEPGYIALETMLLHASGEFISSRARVRLQKDDPQGAGSGLTYLRRYALSAAMGIVADDDDGHAASQGPQNRQQAAPRQNTRPTTAQGQQQASQGTRKPDPQEAIGPERAQKLHAYLGGILKDTEFHGSAKNDEFVALAIGREIRHWQDITNEEASRLNRYVEEFMTEHGLKKPAA